MSDERPIIKFALNFQHDARPHLGWFYAPDGWDDYTAEQREKFMAEEAKLWHDEQVEVSWAAYANAADARADDHGWGAYFEGESVEERF